MFTCELKKYFVYVLIDPRDNEVFYVGEGVNKRELDHKGNKDGSEKEKTIYSIEQLGKEVNRVIVGRYDSKDEALSVETTLIKWVYGYDNLTNIQPGKNHYLVRPHDQKINNEYTDITGIDREKNINFQTGEYTQDQKDKILNNNIYEKLEELSQYLHSNVTEDISISAPDISKPQDPHILISGFSEYVKLVIKINLLGTNFGFSYVPNGGGRCFKDEFDKSIKSLIDNVQINNGNIYGTSYVGVKDEGGNRVTISIENKEEIKEKVSALIKFE